MLLMNVKISNWSESSYLSFPRYWKMVNLHFDFPLRADLNPRFEWNSQNSTNRRFAHSHCKNLIPELTFAPFYATASQKYTENITSLCAAYQSHGHQINIEQSSELFIFASTILNFIDSKYSRQLNNPRHWTPPGRSGFRTPGLIVRANSVGFFSRPYSNVCWKHCTSFFSMRSEDGWHALRELHSIMLFPKGAENTYLNIPCFRAWFPHSYRALWQIFRQSFHMTCWPNIHL